ncbi:hypothetical protein NM688_g7498 [Phlebia brevispora]|uniref:Uncharacterized protein n=1 Tax=Phlebia brevispora TaxID=194682 RepID=A0ACC1S4G9_9APHY|nr:hypothetical protein NM688_g7498 [Phlebia brevispora]
MFDMTLTFAIASRGASKDIWQMRWRVYVETLYEGLLHLGLASSKRPIHEQEGLYGAVSGGCDAQCRAYRRVGSAAGPAISPAAGHGCGRSYTTPVLRGIPEEVQSTTACASCQPPSGNREARSLYEGYDFDRVSVFSGPVLTHERRTNKGLIHALKELLRSCAGGSAKLPTRMVLAASGKASEYDTTGPITSSTYWIRTSFLAQTYSSSKTLQGPCNSIFVDLIPHHPFLTRLDHTEARIAQNAMEPAVFELEIPKEWRFSRISYPGRGPIKWDRAWTETGPRYIPKMQEVTDPMDEEKYKESTAFPLLKPNIEVFGLPPPATLRRQRGWYQRKRWPPTKGKEVVRWTGAATGADVPQELFDNVIRHLYLRHSGVRASKRELGQISLVCRRWAKLIRPKIFEQLELRNRDDADTLLSFVRCPTSVISGYIKSLTLKLSVNLYPYAPWIHTVCFLILHRLPTKPDIELTVEGPLPSNKAMTGVHDMVPPTYPHCSSGITYLGLCDVQFKSFVDIMRTIGDMPNLQQVNLSKVTWNHSQDEEFRPPPARRARFKRHPQYHMDHLDELDADRLYRITSLLKGSNMTYLQRGNMGPDAFIIMVQGLNHIFLHYVYVILTSHVEGQPRHIQAIAFGSGTRRWQKLVDVDWKEIDNLIASLSALETLLFFFEGKDDVLPVHRDIIAQKMAHFKHSHKLKYALNFGFYADKTWAQVACADDGTIKELGPRYEGDYGWKQFV